MIKRFKPKSEFSSNVLTLMTGTTIAQAIPIAISPILTRLYAPEDFGVFALFIAIVSIPSVVASGRYELALMLPKKEEDTINLFALGVAIIIVLTLVLLSLILFIYLFMSDWITNSKIGYWLYFVPVAFFFIGLFNLLSYYNNRQKNYKDIANATIIKSIVLAIVQLVMGFLKMGAGGLIWGQIVSSFFANMRLLKNIIKDRTLLDKIKKTKMLALARRYKDFPKYQALHAVLNTLSSQIPVYMFMPFFGLTVVGFYALSTRIIFAPLMILAGATAKVYSQRVTQLYNENGDAYGFTIKLLKSLAKKIIVPFVIVVVFAPEIFAFAFGEEWREAGVYTQILSPWLFLNVLISTVSFIPSLTGMQKKAFVVSLFYITFVVSAILLGAYYESIYIALALYASFACMTLLYNLQWMLKTLRRNL